MSQWKSHVKVPNSFFAKSKSEYRDWQWAFIRELIQNSYDAGATRIDFSLKVDSNGDTIIQCFDDGKGMNQTTLTDVLLCLGGSEKDKGAVGGFGYAKHILFFAHKRYSIWTKDWVVDGTGGDYNLETAKMPLPRGTDITVVMEHSSHMDENFEPILRQYVSNMNPERAVAISFTKRISGLNYDKVLLEQSCAAYKYAVPSEVGMLKFSETTNKLVSLIVSVHGLPMFEHREYTPDRGIKGTLELTGVSYEVLTTNREAFRDTYESAYSALIRTVILDRFTIKRSPNHRLLFNTQKPRLMKAGHSVLANSAYPSEFIVSIPTGAAVNISDAVKATLSLFKKPWLSDLAVVWKAYVFALALEGALVEGNHVKLTDEVGDSPSIDNLMDFLNHEDYTVRDSAGNEIITGFTLDEEHEGVNMVVDNVRMVLINPTYYTETFWHQEIQDLAIHEMTHVVHSGHGEDFMDLDMKIRRSFRRAVKESAFRLTIKEHLMERL